MGGSCSGKVCESSFVSLVVSQRRSGGIIEADLQEEDFAVFGKGFGRASEVMISG
jgi:hypothetical protein